MPFPRVKVEPLHSSLVRLCALCPIYPSSLASYDSPVCLAPGSLIFGSPMCHILSFLRDFVYVISFVQHVFCIASLSQIQFIQYVIIEVYSFPSGKFSHIVIKHSPHGDRIMGCPPDSLFQESRSCGWPSCQASQESIARSEISNFQFSTFVVCPFLAAFDKNNHFGHDTFPISTSGVLSGHPHSWTLLLSPSLDPSPYSSSKQLYILLSSSD